MARFNDGGAPGFLVYLLLVSSLVAPKHITEQQLSCMPQDSYIPNEDKFDCMPGFNVTITQAECLSRNCCWQALNNQNKSGPYDPEFPSMRIPIHIGAPSCYYPSNYPSYTTVNFTTTSYGVMGFLERDSKSPYPNDVTLLRMDVYFETNTRLRVKITDPENNRYEVPVPRLPTVETAASDPDYTFNVTEKGARFSVVRASTKEVIFDASVGSFIFSDRFIQLSALLPSTNLYGLGQHNDNFRRSFDWQLIPLFASYLYPDYGSHPFYLAIEKSRNSHGVFLFNSNAMDVLLQPTPAITYRTTGGILDFFFFLGPTSENVIEQYTTLIGKPILPPYWTLGFHLCKYNYMSTENVRETWTRNVDAGIPLDAQWNDIDYMDNYKIFTYNKVDYAGLPTLIDDIHAKHMKYVPITDCGVSALADYDTYNNGLKMEIFVKNASGTGLASGRVWPDHAVFTDFTNPSASTFWTTEFTRMYKEIKYDGAWIDMNEPSTFSAGSVENEGCSDKVDDLPFTPAVDGGVLYAHTICMGSKQYGGSHHDLHNLYGFTEAIATNAAMTATLDKRPFVMSRSTFPGHGHYATHWTGDVYSSWHDLRHSIPGILNFNLYGIPMVGADICGFRGNTSLELCQRWTALGAFYPFARNHNENITIEQDPVALGQEMVDTAIKMLKTRYMLLPFFYTQFYKAHLYGGTVVRPLFFEFPEDEATYGIDDQFMWGQNVLVLPVLEEGSTTIRPYMPKGLWYMFPENTRINSTGATYTFNVSILEVVFGLRGGSVMVMQKTNQTTYDSRKNDFELIIGLDENLEATGELYWDNGDSIDPVENNVYTHITFQVADNSLTSVVQIFNYAGDVPMVMGAIGIGGVPEAPTRVLVNKKEFSFVYASGNLLLTDVKIPLKDPFTVTWEYGGGTSISPGSTTTNKPPTTKGNCGVALSSFSGIILFIISTIFT